MLNRYRTRARPNARAYSRARAERNHGYLPWFIEESPDIRNCLSTLWTRAPKMTPFFWVSDVISTVFDPKTGSSKSAKNVRRSNLPLQNINFCLSKKTPVFAVFWSKIGQKRVKNRGRFWVKKVPFFGSFSGTCLDEVGCVFWTKKSAVFGGQKMTRFLTKTGSNFGSKTGQKPRF